MTSITSNVTSIPQASPSTNSSAPSNSTHARTPSVSGQTSSSAAVQGNAPAQRVVSYAHAASNAALKKPSTPVIAASPSPQIPVGAPAQNARSSSAASQAVNGKIPPAVANSGPSPANGNNTPFTGGHHSRKSSVASGAGGSIMPNGAPRAAPPIMFGAINEAGAAPSGSAAAASNASLTAPVASNQRVSSPQSSPSPIVQPMASGGAPPQASGTGNRPIQFGDATHHHQQNPRPMSMPPPVGPGGMGNIHPSHQRRESTQSAHTDTGPSHHHGRGGMQGAGRGSQPYRQNNHHQFTQGQYGNSGYGRGYAPNPNQARGQPPIHNQQYQGAGPVQGYNPNSPRMVNRSPAMAHVSPALTHAQPVGTPQLYPPHYIAHPPQQQFGGLQASMHYDPSHHPHHPQQMYGYYNQNHLTANYSYQIPQTSPRVNYIQPVNGGYGYLQQSMPQSMPQSMSQSMSRSGSTNMPHMEAPRPNSSMGQLPTPTLTPQPITVPPPNSVAPALATPSSPFAPRAKSQAIPIVNPSDGTVVKPAPSPVVVNSTPVIVSSPSPAPGRTVSRDSQHSKPTSKNVNSKSDKEKREELRASVQKKVEEDRIQAEEEEKKKRKQQEEAAALEKERIEAEKKAMEERLRLEKEEQERKLKEAEEERIRKQEAEEKARKEAEEEAKRKQEEEERIKKEAEEAEAEAARVAKEKAEEEARIAKEKAEEEARLEAEKAQKLKEEEEAKAKAEAEAEAKAAAEAAQKAALSAPSVPKASPDSESMPPPAAKSAEKRGKPSPLNLQIKTNEPAPPSAALTALKSARFIENINSVNYPSNILSPNPALNPAASGKFKYEKDFLLQFQGVFTEKPSVDWDKTMRDTVGEPETARPQTARTPSGLGPRNTSRSGSAIPPPMGAFGSFKPTGLPANMLTSAQRFEQSRSNSLPAVNPLAAMAGSFSGSRSGGVGIMRTNSSSSLASSGVGVPQSPRTGNRSSRGGSRKGGGAPMEKTESRQGDKNNQPTISITDVKPLPVSENRWKPISIGAPKELQAAPTPSEEVKLSPELVQRKVKAALNKMTPEKFDKIAGQILEITSQSKFETDGRTLRQVIQLTFEKATDEAAWSSMYARFCKRMLESMDPNIKDENIRDKNGLIVTGGNLFRKYLLNRCQEEFERGWKVNLPPKPEGVSDEAVMLSDEYYIAAAAKRRGLGLVQFIGELFKLGMLTERIMNECVRKLLDFEGLPEDETVESLCKLLKTIGFQLDGSDKSRGMMDVYFVRIARLAEDKELNSRMRFMLMDIIDLRRKKWETKEADKGPKTIQEVREDALKAQQEKEAASRANQRSRPNNGGGGRGGDGRSFSGFGGNQMHPPGWDQSKGGLVNAEDLRRLSAKSRQISGPPGSFGPSNMLGPRSSSNGSRRGGFGLGPNRGTDDSNASSRTATPPAKTSTSHANPFSALQDGASAHHESGEQNDTTSSPASSPPTAALGFGRSRSPLPIVESK